MSINFVASFATNESHNNYPLRPFFQFFKESEKIKQIRLKRVKRGHSKLRAADELIKKKAPV